MVSIDILSTILSFRSISSSSSPSSISRPSHVTRNAFSNRKKRKIVTSCTSATSIMFLLAVANLVASSIEHSSPKSLFAAPTPSIPREQIDHHINNRIIPPGLLGLESIVELAPETHSTPDGRTEFGKRQVSAPWPTASQPPPGESSIPTTTITTLASTTTITTLASTTSSNPQTTTSPQTSLRPTASIPDTPHPTVKPYLLTDFEYETMWNPNYNSLRLGVLLPFNAKATGGQAIVVRKTMSVRSGPVQLLCISFFVLLVEFVPGEKILTAIDSFVGYPTSCAGCESTTINPW